MKSNTSVRTTQERGAAISGSERCSDGKVRLYETAPVRGGKNAPGINHLILSDLTKFARWRRGGMGLWDLGLAEAVLADAIPRLTRTCLRSEAGFSVVCWCSTHLPEIIEHYGPQWVEHLRQEIDGATYGTLRTVDEIARRLGTTQDDVEGAAFESLVSVERPKAKRKADDKKRRREAEQARRIRNGATPRSQSKMAREPWKAKGMSRSAYYEKGLHKAVNENPVDGFVPYSPKGVNVSHEIVQNHITRPDATAADNGTVRPIGGSISLRRVFIRLPQPRPTRDDDRGVRVPVRAG